MDIEQAIALSEAFCAAPPTSEQWFARREKVTELGNKYYNNLGGTRPPEKFRVLERELERTYCSGSFLACIVFASTLVELLLGDVNESSRKILQNQLEYIKDELEVLRNARNDIAHYLRAPDSLSLHGYVFEKGNMEGHAGQAISLVYHVARAYLNLDPNTAFTGTRREAQI